VRALDARKEEPTLCAAIRTQPLHANGRYSPKSDHLLRCHEMTLWARSGLMHCNIIAEKEPDYQHLYPQCAVRCITFVQGRAGTFQMRLHWLAQIS
jgi:hypothetical protein